jgi:arylsulfatase A
MKRAGSALCRGQKRTFFFFNHEGSRDGVPRRPRLNRNADHLKLLSENSMRKNTTWIIPMLFLLLTPSGYGQQPPASAPNPTSLPGAESRVYKTIGETKLHLHVFQPAQRKKNERLPAIIFFFGGGWTNGTVRQFVTHSEYLASRGMVAVVADYRVKSRHGVTPLECVADAKSAIRWLRAHAADFGVDAQRIAAGGGSAGGHLAASAALAIGFDEKGEDLKISSAPNALVLFNPALDLNAPRLREMIGEKALDISPLRLVRQGAPPTIIFHGTADTTVPIKQAEDFCAAMKKRGSRCELKSFEGRGHGFFNYGRGDNSDFNATLRATDEFLVSLGYLNAQPAARRPNVLLIITDDQGYGDLALHGNEQTSTPTLDKLGRESIRFDRFFVSPLCAPTRASLLTGRYSLRTGVSGVAEGQETMRAEEVTIAEALRDAGYRTGLFGKWHNGEHYPFTPNGQGFQEAFGFNLGHWNNYFDTTLKRNGRSVKTKGFITDVLTDAALKFISAKHDQPFFCYLSYNAPHAPFQVPDKYFDKYKAKGLDDYLASVYGMVENVDDNVARVLGRLDELKLRDNTIVIFMTDNGPNGQRFNGGMRGVKGSLHEGGSRVPFFLRWPARFKQPRLIKQIVAHVDVFPTLLELSNAPKPETLPQDGRSLVPLLEGKEENWPDRMLFTQHRLNPNTGAVRTARYRIVNEGRGWELFDMESDPGQKKNIAAEQPEVTKRLTTAYEAWRLEVWPQTRSSRAPIPVGHAEENPVELPVPQSQFTGGLRYSGRHPNNAWLTNWTNVEATVEWELEVVKAGRYEVSLQYLCPKNSAGSRVRISVAGSATEVTIRETNGQQIKSPDRVPRTEVYEMDWATLQTGAIRLPQGRTKLTVRALTKPGEVVMDLKSVALKMSLQRGAER